MLLRRIGNKTKLAPEIIKYFPAHDIYIELFFGAGGLFFNKFPVAKYNFLNDIDKDVYNLFNLLKNGKADEIYNQIELIPLHERFFKDFLKKEESEPVKKAVRFLYLSNYSYLGLSNTLRFRTGNTKSILLNNIKKHIDILKNNNCQFICDDFRNVINKIHFQHEDRKIPQRQKAFIYADPPYFNTDDNYSNSFKKQDVEDLFALLITSGIRFAYSEFNQPFILETAKKYDLTVIPICERRTLKNRNTEILITNYELQNNELF